MDIKWRGIRYMLAEDACEEYIDCFNYSVVSLVYTPVKPEELEQFLGVLDSRIRFIFPKDVKSTDAMTLRCESVVNAANRVNTIFNRMSKIDKSNKREIIVSGIFRDEYNKIGVRLYNREKE